MAIPDSGRLPTLVQLASALLLGVLFRRLHRSHRRRRYLGLWSHGWFALGLAMAALAAHDQLAPGPAVLLAESPILVRLLYTWFQFASLVFLVLLAAGVLYHARGSLPAGYFQASITGSALYAAASILFAGTFEQLIMLQAPAAVLATVTAGCMVIALPGPRRSQGSRALGVVLLALTVLWTSYFFAFGLAAPPLPEVPGPAILSSLVHYHSYLDAFAWLALGCTMVLVLWEEAKRDANDARAEVAVMHDQAQRSLLYDSITGSLNRRAFEDGIGLEAARARNGAVIMIDLDDLAAINAAHSFAAGDAVLRHLVDGLRPALRAADRLYRWGGDEFLLVLPGAEPEQARQRIQNLLDTLPPVAAGPAGFPTRIRVILGRAFYSSADDLVAAVERAEAEVYTEKERRRVAAATRRREL